MDFPSKERLIEAASQAMADKMKVDAGNLEVLESISSTVKVVLEAIVRELPNDMHKPINNLTTQEVNKIVKCYMLLLNYWE